MASSAAIESARQRRVTAAEARSVRIQWFIENVSDTVAITMRNRVRMAAEFLRSKIVQNISRPVNKYVGPRSGRIQVNQRSVAGEFPKADTTRLMKDIFYEVVELQPGVIDGAVGTTLDYGAILETNAVLDRAYLTRTLFEEASTLQALLTGPIA